MAWTVPVEINGHPSKATATTAANVRQLVVAVAGWGEAGSGWGQTALS